MAYIYYNPNPNNTGDCVIRALSKVLNQSWDITYWDLCDIGYLMFDWGNKNIVWDTYLRDCGFIRRVIPDTCPDCYTVKDFCIDHPYGRYVLATGEHTIAVVNGDVYDSFNSLNEHPIYYYEKPNHL